MKRCVESLQKQTMGVTFNSHNYHFPTFSYRQANSAQVNDPNRLSVNLPIAKLLFSTARKAITKAKWLSDSTWLFYPSSKFLGTRYQFSTLVSNNNPTKLGQTTVDEHENALPFIQHPHRVAQKASDVSPADWRCQTPAKNYNSGYFNENSKQHNNFLHLLTYV